MCHQEVTHNQKTEKERNRRTLTGAGGVGRVSVRSVVAGPAGADAGRRGAGAGVGGTRGAEPITLLRLKGPRTAGCTKQDQQNTVRTSDPSALDTLTLKGPGRVYAAVRDVYLYTLHTAPVQRASHKQKNKNIK